MASHQSAMNTKFLGQKVYWQGLVGVVKKVVVGNIATFLTVDFHGHIEKLPARSVMLLDELESK